MTENQEAAFSAAVGREEEAEDFITQSPLRRLAATLDQVDPPWRAGEVPPLGHWLFFLPVDRQSTIGPDGHAARGGFLPNLDLPRRMWAGSSLEFIAPLPIGASARRVSRINSIKAKTGRSGRMVFVSIGHTVSSEGRICIREEQNLVYRKAARPGAQVPPEPGPAKTAADFVRTLKPDAVELFRYSALTFNGHRIHYDSDYTREVEGYPGLIIHGPLVATLMIDHFLRARPGADVAQFTFRALQPMFIGDSLTFLLREGDSSHDLWVTKDDGTLTVRGQISVRD